jgi:hypothetical protein
MGDYKFGKDIYTMSFVMTLDKTKTPKEYFTNKTDINSNGKTIDPTVDSLGSSILFYGSKDVIELKSPTLPLTEDMLKQKEEKLPSDDKKTSSTPNTSNDKFDNSPKTADTFNIIAVVGLLISSLMIIVQKRRLIKNRY